MSAVLESLEALAAEHGGIAHGHSAAVIRLAGGPRVETTLAELEERGWARRLGEDSWALTDAGRAELRRQERDR
jgi:hypothetical protein